MVLSAHVLAEAVDVIQDPPYIFIHRVNRPAVALHVPLVFEVP